jgi:hypothetical protein
MTLTRIAPTPLSQESEDMGRMRFHGRERK